MPNLRGRSKESNGSDRKDKSDEEFDFGTVEEAEDGCRGSGQKNESESEPTKQGGAKTEKGEASGQANLKDKARTKTWSYVVKGLEKEESETVD